MASPRVSFIVFPYVSNDRGFSLLPMPPGYPYGVARGVNDAGTVVGHMHPTPAGLDRRAFIYDGNAVVNLGTLPGATQSFAFAISDEKPPTAVGYSHPSSRAVRWVDGVIDELVLPMGPNSVAADVSPNGHIAGWMGSSPLVGPSAAFVWYQGRAIGLPPLPGAYACEAAAVNDNGDACGSCLFDIKGTLAALRKAVLWKDGKAIDLRGAARQVSLRGARSHQ
ncbi:MAG: hypothetical protein SGJ11_15430 [Phycisphaerae bacterium]|nr:hypothetical protein [Phycisphaerae bacterium]